ncbi:DNA polymerase IV [Sulfuriroseicoccus oceanibius]|uniref:DNA polymerase IV n=1 Tax=Sulfuriroseicoccus oceanibius TaxID=2707525 RepID=A0A7T7JBR8_9BACT|nr:DNA polymerase IV [Sulfuriroseicoccus oceanibius]QQL44349.1 DNA polymerase IV [Sulfuriroseicoccus oceanibius]
MEKDSPPSTPPRKIIHIDMDCFYAAIEERDHPEYRGKPIAVGGSSRRGVLTTANYEARKYGCRSAMPVFKAKELCPELIITPIRFDVYREVSAQVREIFSRFTPLIEPLSLDEAYLDVSHRPESAIQIAATIRRLIHQETRLTASAGISYNKLLAKIASDWRKPNGQYEVTPRATADFMHALPVKRLWGVGKVTAEKLHALGLETCADVLNLDPITLARELGRFGMELREQCQGIDTRPVTPHRERKSHSIERTFEHNIDKLEPAAATLQNLIDDLYQELHAADRIERIAGLVVKLKFDDFTTTTAEQAGTQFLPDTFLALLDEAWNRRESPSVRLLGVGVRLAAEKETNHPSQQLSLELPPA